MTRNQIEAFGFLALIAIVGLSVWAVTEIVYFEQPVIVESGTLGVGTSTGSATDLYTDIGSASVATTVTKTTVTPVQYYRIAGAEEFCIGHQYQGGQYPTLIIGYMDGGTTCTEILRFYGDGWTVGEGSVWVTGQLNYLRGEPSLVFGGSPDAATISSGAITFTSLGMSITAESGGVDDLDTISGGSSDLLMLRAASGQTITVKDGTGNIYAPADCVLDDPKDVMWLVNESGTYWYQIACNDNA